MLRLMLMRHAKAASPEGVADMERPLHERGRATAPLIGAHMGRARLNPERALISPARRARETWDLVAPAFSAASQAEFDPHLYNASAGELLAIIHAAPSHVRSLLVLAHNPGIEELARALVGDGDKNLRASLKAKFPPAALAVLDFPVEDWSVLKPRGGKLVRFVTPKSLGPAEE